MAEHTSSIRTTVVKMIALALAMFAFAMWVMPPLYDLFCEVTGINGKTKGQYTEAVSAEIDTSRKIKVQFMVSNNSGMPWEFAPEEHAIYVHPGEAVTTNFLAHNPTQNIMVGQAVPSLAPKNATDYFLKTECFCFNSQTLGPDEHAKLGLQFIVDQEVPKKVKTITLSYTLFDVTDNASTLVEQKAAEIAAKKFQQ